MRRRTILKGIGAAGLIAAGTATPGLAAVTDAPDGSQLYLNLDDDSEYVPVDREDLRVVDDGIAVDLADGQEEIIDPICGGCCQGCDCACLCYWCPPDDLM